MQVEHPDTLNSINNLAATMRAQGDHAAARACGGATRLATRRLRGERMGSPGGCRIDFAR
jgi:hypothetical protein